MIWFLRVRLYGFVSRWDGATRAHPRCGRFWTCQRLTLGTGDFFKPVFPSRLRLRFGRQPQPCRSAPLERAKSAPQPSSDRVRESGASEAFGRHYPVLQLVSPFGRCAAEAAERYNQRTERRLAMASPPSHRWQGASLTWYEYFVYPSAADV